jgi:DNA repair protein RecN (Recombination protein N)
MNMDRADIKITINKKNEISKDGIDNVDILLKTNPEAEFLTIKKIASGGELSRLMLALKLIQGKTNKVKTIIFDEIDSGIGGHTALLTGEKLKTLSEKIQVILITHQAQIASISDNLLLVTKKHTDNTTTISTHYLNSKERKIELECMITGKRKNT